MRNENIEKRLQTLFSRQDEDELDKDKEEISKEIDEMYMSVNEQITTDTPFTSEGEDDETKRLGAATRQVDGSEMAQKMIQKQAGLAESSEDEAQEPQGEVGIQSSDEEGATNSLNENTKIDQTESVADLEAEKHSTSSKKGTKNKLYEDDRERENIVHKFNFDDMDVDRYTKNISDQFDIKSTFDK